MDEDVRDNVKVKMFFCRYVQCTKNICLPKHRIFTISVGLVSVDGVKLKRR